MDSPYKVRVLHPVFRIGKEEIKIADSNRNDKNNKRQNQKPRNCITFSFGIKFCPTENIQELLEDTSCEVKCWTEDFLPKYPNEKFAKNKLKNIL